jgi:hypothetical protein
MNRHFTTKTQKTQSVENPKPLSSLVLLCLCGEIRFEQIQRLFSLADSPVNANVTALILRPYRPVA